MDVSSTGAIQKEDSYLIWLPPPKNALFEYTIKIPQQRPASGSSDRKFFDSYINPKWALFRGEDLVPPASITRVGHPSVIGSIALNLPSAWTSVNTGLPRIGSNVFHIDTNQKTFARPKGWMIAGKLGTRHEKLADTNVTISAPEGHNFHQMEVLSFLSMLWPSFTDAFSSPKKSLPPKILIAGASNPMWRGGLSSPNSMFIHSARPLVSENGTSTLIHELVHIITGIHGAKKQDWIAEGIAEFYSVELLFRSGAYSLSRRTRVFSGLRVWSKAVKTLNREHSTSKVTAKAAVFFDELNTEIIHKSKGEYNLDDLIVNLDQNKKVALSDLQKSFTLLINEKSSVLFSATTP